MLSIPRRALTAVLLGGAVITPAIGAAGCTPAAVLGLRPGRVAGPVQVTLAIPAAALQLSAGQPALERVRVTLVKDAHVLTREQSLLAPPAQDEALFSFTFQQVYEGRWRVAGELVDAEGDTVYAGSATLYVARGQTSTVRLVLAACPAILRVNVDLTDYARESNVTAAGVRLKGSDSTTLRSARPSGALSWSFERERPAGTFDVQVLLYQQEGTLEFSSDWREGVALLPGKATGVTWRPGTGTAIVVGEVDLVPSPPSAVACRGLAAERQLEVAWTAPAEPDLAGYRVYLRPPGSTLRLKAEVGAGETQALLSDPDLPWETGGSAYVGVTAVDLAGQESLHAPVECTIPAPGA